MPVTITLLSIACIIANKGRVDTSGIEAQLTEKEKVRVQEYIDSGACLPRSIEKLIVETKDKIRSGEIKINGKPSPSDGCF